MADLDPQNSPEEDSKTVATRVTQARAAAAKRLAQTKWKLNSEVPGPYLRKNFPLIPPVRSLLIKSGKNFSARGADRTIRLAWTISDLNGHDQPTLTDLEEALIFRDGNGSWQI